MKFNLFIGSSLLVSVLIWIFYFIIAQMPATDLRASHLILELFVPCLVAVIFGWTVANLLPIRLIEGSPYVAGLIFVFFYSIIDLITRNFVIRILEPVPLTQAIALAAMAPFFTLVTIGVVLVPALFLVGLGIGTLFSRASAAL